MLPGRSKIGKAGGDAMIGSEGSSDEGMVDPFVALPFCADFTLGFEHFCEIFVRLLLESQQLDLIKWLSTGIHNWDVYLWQ